MQQTNSGRSFYSLANGILTIGNELFSHSFADVLSAVAETADSDGLAVPYTKITAHTARGTRTYCVWDDLPLVWMPEYREDPLLTLQGEHWSVRTVKLNAFTDDNDTLALETFVSLVNQKLGRDQHGEIFYLENIETGNAIVIIAEMADYATATLSIKKNTVRIQNDNNGLVLGFCKIGQCEALTRAYYRHGRLCKELVTMSNTWGDGNGFDRVCQEFVLKEIDAGSDIGIDIVQIDDGWQTGSTADTTRRDADGQREFVGDFWDLAEDRFPDGMKHVTDYAHARNIRTGMWFAPDSHSNFALLDRDLEVLRKAYDEWGIRFFKLDMYNIRNRMDQARFLELLHNIYSFGPDVAVQLDVTRGSRVNYLCGKQYGTVFVENRYTFSANSFPHRILRNLWTIGQYLPTSKFQFELVNPDLNREKYSPTDPFAPALYDMDYLFATVMLCNPLFWMEMQFLSPERRSHLKGIMDVWKAHREALAQADVMPIGERPSGRSFTGFYISKDSQPQYLLLFREVTEDSCGTFRLPTNVETAEVLASNAEVCVQAENSFVRADFSKPRAYVFLKLK